MQRVFCHDGIGRSCENERSFQTLLLPSPRRFVADGHAVVLAARSTEALNELKQFFPASGLYLTVVPSYVGGFMALSWAGTGASLGSPAGIKRAAARYKAAKLKTDYYNPEMHAAAFAFPEWVKRLVPKTSKPRR